MRPSRVSPSGLHEHELNAILAAALDPIVSIGFDGVIRFASDSVERVFGWRPSELIGQNVNTLMPEPFRSEHDGHLRRYQATGETHILGQTREYRGQRKDGSTFPVEIAVARADPPGDGGPVFVGILRDVSERRRWAEMLRQRGETLERIVHERTKALENSHEQLRVTDRFASLGTLAAGLGHDMSNVLLPILCRLDALEAESLPEGARENVSGVRESVEYLRQLTNALRLLTLDPNDEGDEDCTDLSEWWGQVSSLFGKLAPHSVRLWFELPDGLAPLAIAPHRLTQAVLNLVVNACEAVHERGFVRITVERDPGNPGMAILAVEDDGHGMSAEVQRRVFDPFFTTKHRGLSTGLGLAIVHGVVRGAGGSVEIRSEEGRGATVSMRLPFAKGMPNTAAGSIKLAAVSVSDPRARAYAEALLVSLNFDTVPAPADRPGAVDVWVTGVSEESYLAARRFLRAKADRVVVALGADDAQAARWRELGAAACRSSSGLGAFRQTLVDAIRKRMPRSD